MTGFNSAARVSGGASVTGALRNYLGNAVELVQEAVQAEQEEFLARQQGRAEGDPQWSGLAQHVGSWEDGDGNFAHGVRGDEQAVIQAGLAEYGDDKNPPSPLLRMGVLSDVPDINRRLTDTFRHGGY